MGIRGVKAEAVQARQEPGYLTEIVVLSLKQGTLLRIPLLQRGSYHLCLTSAPLLPIIRCTENQIVGIRVGSRLAGVHLTSNPLIKRRKSYEK